MKCWCDDTGIVCADCDAERTWNRLKRNQQFDLIVYKKKLDKDELSVDLSKRILDQNLCVSMIPKKYFAHNN
jgi:hypothetical protein